MGYLFEFSTIFLRLYNLVRRSKKHKHLEKPIFFILLSSFFVVRLCFGSYIITVVNSSKPLLNQKLWKFHMFGCFCALGLSGVWFMKLAKKAPGYMIQ